MKDIAKEDTYDFPLSELSDNSIKKISDTKDAVINTWKNEKGSYGACHDREIKLSEVIEQIYVCLPNYDMPGHPDNINFLVEFKDNLSPDLDKDKSRIGNSLKMKLQKLFGDIDVNVYSKNDIIDKTKTPSMLPESLIQEYNAIAYAGIPIAEFNCQTLKEFHDQTQVNFKRWQDHQMDSYSKSSSESVKVESKEMGTLSTLSKGFDSPLRDQEQIFMILGISQEKFLVLPKNAQSEVEQSMKSFLESLEKFKLLNSNNKQSMSPRATITSPKAQLVQTAQQGLTQD